MKDKLLKALFALIAIVCAILIARFAWNSIEAFTSQFWYAVFGYMYIYLWRKLAKEYEC